MPDITMCPGNDCPLKEKCYRYRAIPDYWQSFFQEAPYDKDQCAYFESIEGRPITDIKDIKEF